MKPNPLGYGTIIAVGLDFKDDFRFALCLSVIKLKPVPVIR